VQEADDVRTGQEKARSGKWATYGLTTEVTVMGKELYCSRDKQFNRLVRLRHHLSLPRLPVLDVEEDRHAPRETWDRTRDNPRHTPLRRSRFTCPPRPRHDPLLLPLARARPVHVLRLLPAAVAGRSPSELPIHSSIFLRFHLSVGFPSRGLCRAPRRAADAAEGVRR
jgi:hypothetical protein